MKKQFAIKVAQVSNNITAAAKHESADMLKFLKPAQCCTTMMFQGLSAKPVFSL